MNKISKISESLASLRLISKKRGLDLKSPKLMGVLNVTPDSFSDGGQFRSFDKALAHASLVQTGSILEENQADLEALRFLWMKNFLE